MPSNKKQKLEINMSTATGSTQRVAATRADMTLSVGNTKVPTSGLQCDQANKNLISAQKLIADSQGDIDRIILTKKEALIVGKNGQTLERIPEKDGLYQWTDERIFDLNAVEAKIESDWHERLAHISPNIINQAIKNKQILIGRQHIPTTKIKNTCDTCAEAKAAQHPHKGGVDKHEDLIPRDVVAWDTVGPIKVAGKTWFVLTCIDYASRWRKVFVFARMVFC